MKQAFILLFIIFIGYSSNNPRSTNQFFSLKTYNLKGKVEYISDKKILSLLSADGQIAPYINELTTIQNIFFDKNGLLTLVDVFDKDSVLLLKSKINRSGSGEYQGSRHFDKEGNLIKETRIISSTANSLETEIFDCKSGKLASKLKTVYENHLPKKQYSAFVEQNYSSEEDYKRDSRGNEIEITTIIEMDDQEKEDKSFVTYLEFDEYGNWIKRMVHNKKDGNECLLTIRTIKYYE